MLDTDLTKIIVGNNAENIKIQLNNKSKHFIILGPSIAPIEKIKKQWRFHILLKIEKSYLFTVYDYIYQQIGFNTFYKKNKDTNIEIEIDPISIL